MLHVAFSTLSMKCQNRFSGVLPVSSYIVAIFKWSIIEITYLFDRGNNVNLSLNCSLQYHLLQKLIIFSYAVSLVQGSTLFLLSLNYVTSSEYCSQSSSWFTIVVQTTARISSLRLVLLFSAFFHLPFFCMCLFWVSPFSQHTQKCSNIKFGFTK